MPSFTLSRPVVTAALAAPLLFLADPGAASGQLSERHILRGDAVAVHNLVGEVRVIPATGQNPEVSVLREGPDGAELRVETRSRGGAETLRVIYPDDRIVYPPMGRRSRARWSVTGNDVYAELLPARTRRVTISGSGRGTEAHADITIHLPPGKRLTVHQAVGSVALENVEGDLRIHTRSASVAARDTRGPLHIEARSGSVRIAGASGDADVTTRSGSVEARELRGDRLRVRARSGSIRTSNLEFAHAALGARSGTVRVDDARVVRLGVDTRSGGVRGEDVRTGDLEVSTRSGRVQLDRLQAGAFRMETRSGRVDLGLAAGFDSGRIRTRSGRVTMRAPADLAAELDLQSRGRIQVDVPARAAEQTRDRFRGRVGDGSASLEIRTRSGAIRLIEG
jgi:DUF4097 and DUF4098 domain-containing protein YvlB